MLSCFFVLDTSPPLSFLNRYVGRGCSTRKKEQTNERLIEPTNSRARGCDQETRIELKESVVAMDQNRPTGDKGREEGSVNAGSVIGNGKG